MASSEGSAALVQSVDRAVSVLEFLALHGEMGITELAAELGVHKSTAFRLVSVLDSRGLVEQTGDRGKYRLGFGIVRLAGATAAQMDLSRESRPVCERLAAQVGETVNVAILDGGYAINVSQVRGNATVATINWVGQRTPLHATSSGKVLLANQPATIREELLARPLTMYTPRTIIDSGLLRAELDAALAAGWASTADELEIGLNAVAVPIRGMDGNVVAALSVSGPSYRLTTDRFAEVARLAADGAKEISHRIGHTG
ncbi:IclR family transcriptional regulator [Kutzneria kofuensis]|uniref:Glycerol operon regulatory protein n=1 Tax=Kutzneria kofuensis TaxID=103725 RepID=A0A7W9NJF7_9PSEU|nr:IclR family transcriptional regulator [Kutzneria kofuensis]MBB5895597.1 DNA-binding IclR family transcriptional regulator [Kutzneria kofuensis]